jgi:ribosomal protein S1
MEDKDVKQPVEEDFESLLKESLAPPVKGSVVRGTVVNISDSDVLINLGYKTEGIADINEFKKNGELTISVGSEVELEVVSVSGDASYVRLSNRNINLKHDIDEVVSSIGKSSVPVKIIRYDENNKKFIGKHGEVEVHILEHQIDHKNRIKEPSYYIGKVFNCKILKFDHKSKTALASRKQYLIESAEEERQKFLHSLKVGDVLKGTVKAINEAGAFVHLGHIDGFVAKENVAWGRVGKVERHLHVGQTVEVKVLGIDMDNKRIDLGIKQLKENPWLSVRSKYEIGSEVKGAVVVRVRNGYIVEIEKGVEAYIPLEELSWIKKSNTILKKGDVVIGRVIAIDDEKEKLVISIKALQENPWEILKREHPEGSIVKGKIKSITDFGLFVDFGFIIDGLIRKSDISWTEEMDNLSEHFKEGDEIEAKIILIDPEKERVALGIKQLEKNPWKEIDKLYPAGKVVEGEIVEVNKDGITISLTKGIKGYIPLKELDENKINPIEAFNVGDTVKATVLKADPKNKEITLSVKKFKSDSERSEVKEYMKKLQKQNDESFNLGSLLKEKLNNQ